MTRGRNSSEDENERLRHARDQIHPGSGSLTGKCSPIGQMGRETASLRSALKWMRSFRGAAPAWQPESRGRISARTS